MQWKFCDYSLQQPQTSTPKQIQQYTAKMSTIIYNSYAIDGIVMHIIRSGVRPSVCPVSIIVIHSEKFTFKSHFEWTEKDEL